MNTFFIQEINLDILNKKNIVEKLKKKLLYNESTEQSILTFDGLYKVKNEDVIKYKIVNKKHYIVQDFLDKYTLFFSKNHYIKDNNIQYNIPYEHCIHTFIRMYFYNADYSKNKMIVDIDNTTNKVVNLYFTSNEDENDFIFQEDISLYLDLLNV